jgi:hypothetical protein
VPIVSDVDAEHTLEVLWWGGAAVWLDELSIELVGRLGCARGLSVAPLNAPAGLLAATTVIDASRRPRVVVARTDDGTGAAILVASPEPAGWTFTPMVTGLALTGTAADLVFQATGRADGGIAAAWSMGSTGVRVAVAPGDGELAAVLGMVGSGPQRLRPDLVNLSDGRLFVGFSSSKATNGRYQPLAFTWDPTAGATGPAWRPSTPDAAVANHVAAVQLDTGQRVLVWTRDDQLRGAIANPDGTVAKADFALHVGTIASPGRVSAAALGGGRFVVVWEQQGQGTDLAASLVDAYGTILVDGLSVPFDPAGEERAPDVAATIDDRFVVVWEDQPAGGNPRLVARVFQGYGEGGNETVFDTGATVRAPRVALRPPYLAELAWIVGNDVHVRSWGFDCSGGTTRCQNGEPQVCVGSAYARLGGTCTGPACAPSPCP